MGAVILGIDALGFNLPSLVAQFINFILLLIVFRVWGYPYLFRILDERKKRIEEGLRASEEAKERLSQTEAEVAQEMARARQQAQGLIAEAQLVSSRIQEEARRAASAEQEQMLDRARSEIQLERDGAIADLRREFADLTISAAERVIRRSLDKDAHKQLIEQVLAEAPAGDDRN